MIANIRLTDVAFQEEKMKKIDFEFGEQYNFMRFTNFTIPINKMEISKKKPSKQVESCFDSILTYAVPNFHKTKF